jgi:predicted MFS family arabinose efflux permease
LTSPWAILVLVLLAQTVSNIGPLGLPAIAPLIRDDLHLSLTQAGSFLSAYYIGPILMSFPAGWLADRWGIRRTMVAGQAVIALGLAAAAFARSFGVMVVLTILAGFGYGMLNPTSTKAIISWFPQRQRATAVGMKQTGLPLGGVLGAALLPLAGLLYGWRLAVIASAASILILAVATLVLYRDPAGLVQTSAAAAWATMRSVLASPPLWLLSLSTLVFAVLQTVWIAFLVLYLHEVVELPLVRAAGYLAQAQLTGILGRVVFGLLSDRLFGGRRKIVLFFAGTGSMVCSLAMSATGPDTPPWLLSFLALSFGFFGIGWNGVQHTLMAELAGPRAAGTAVGLGLAISSLGVTIGPPIFGWAVERIGNYRLAWVGLAASMAVALTLLGRVREGRPVFEV